MLEDIYNFLRLDDRIVTGGMPTTTQLADASRAGVQMVINLAMPDSERALPGEAAVVRSLRMKYLNIPVRWDQPTRRDLDAFMDAMDANQDLKLLVHCQANYRATAFVALYRVLRLGWRSEDALQSVKRIWDPADFPTWDRFVTDNLPRAGDEQ